jgi:hypothetical protein
MLRRRRAASPLHCQFLDQYYRIHSRALPAKSLSIPRGNLNRVESILPGIRQANHACQGRIMTCSTPTPSALAPVVLQPRARFHAPGATRGRWHKLQGLCRSGEHTTKLSVPASGERSVLCPRSAFHHTPHVPHRVSPTATAQPDSACSRLIACTTACRFPTLPGGLFASLRPPYYATLNT